jgi:hypothetical protein
VAAPVIDTLCASYFVVNAFALSAAPECTGGYGHPEGCADTATKHVGIGASVALAGLCALSARSGYESSSRCKAENAGLIPVGRPDGSTEWRAIPEPADPSVP